MKCAKRNSNEQNAGKKKGAALRFAVEELPRIAVGAAEIAKVSFFICIALFLVFLVIGLLAAQ